MKPADSNEDSELFPWLGDLWEGRLYLVAALVVSMATGAFYAWWAPPVYQSEAMLQVQAKKERPSDASLTKMENLFSDPVEARSEIEIIKSNLVLGRTVDALALDVVAEPVLAPVIGPAMARRSPTAPLIEVAAFGIPAILRGHVFHLTALAGGEFQLNAPDGTLIAKGRPKEEVRATYSGEPLSLQIRHLVASPGQKFNLVLKPAQDAIEALRLNLEVSERGKLTNILGVSLRGTNPTTCQLILNQILDQYVRHKLENRSAEITRAQAMLAGRMPALKAQVEAAESKLNQFRSRSGSVDLTREADVFLSQSASLTAQVSGLKQKREELLRTYRENAEVVVTLDHQIAKLQQEQGQVESKVRVLPKLQQEVVRLSRDAQVATELYTALLNNIQQLQIASAGDIGNIVVVDRASISFEPIAPKNSVVMLFFLFLGLVSGVGLVVLRKALRGGIEDHRIIESKLGLPVFVTIPHSKAQQVNSEAAQRGGVRFHLLASKEPGDLAVESLRSLRTMLNFYMKDAENPVILISGPSPAIGKSFISANFAVVLAQSGSKVLLIDGDLRRGKLHKYFGLKNRLNGLSDFLSGQQAWDSVVQATGIEGLDIISTGLLPPNPSDLLMTPRLGTLLKQASDSYDMVIVDVPPVLPVTDATILGATAGTVLLVAKFGQHPLDEIRTAVHRFESHGIRVKGCIFNDVQPVGWGTNYRRYNYIYNYSFKK